MAGICGAVVALLVVVSAARFYGWPLIDHAWLTIVAVAAGFLLVAVGYLRAKRLHLTARREELTHIDADEDAAE